MQNIMLTCLLWLRIKVKCFFLLNKNMFRKVEFVVFFLYLFSFMQYNNNNSNNTLKNNSRLYDVVSSLFIFYKNYKKERNLKNKINFY